MPKGTIKNQMAIGATAGIPNAWSGKLEADGEYMRFVSYIQVSDDYYVSFRRRTLTNYDLALVESIISTPRDKKSDKEKKIKPKSKK